MNVQSNDKQNRFLEGTSYPGDNTLTELFAQQILDKESLKE